MVERDKKELSTFGGNKAVLYPFDSLRTALKELYQGTWNIDSGCNRWLAGQVMRGQRRVLGDFYQGG